MCGFVWVWVWVWVYVYVYICAGVDGKGSEGDKRARAHTHTRTHTHTHTHTHIHGHQLGEDSLAARGTPRGLRKSWGAQDASPTALRSDLTDSLNSYEKFSDAVRNDIKVSARACVGVGMGVGW